MKCNFGILIDDFGSLTILQQQELTILVLPLYKYRISFHVFSFSSMLYSFQCIDFSPLWLNLLLSILLFLMLLQERLFF